MNFKRTLVVAGISLAASQGSYACDVCVEKMIKLGFDGMKVAVDSLASSVDGVADSVDSLKDQIKSSSDDNVNAIETFSSDVQDSLVESTNTIAKSLTGLILTIDATSKLEMKVSQDLALALDNQISEVARGLAKKIEIDNKYRAGGEFGHFAGGEIVTAILQIYKAGASKAQRVYLKHADYVSSWNNRKKGFGIDGRRTLLNQSYKQVMENADTLLLSLSHSSVLTTEEYRELLRFLTIGLNKDQLQPEQPEYLKVNAKQAELLTRILYKAPIIELSESNYSVIKDVLSTAPIPYEQCPQDEVRAESSCTSLYSLLEALVYRTLSADYSNKLNLASERAILEELNRAMTVSNIITRYENQMRGQHDITESLGM